MQKGRYSRSKDNSGLFPGSFQGQSEAHDVQEQKWKESMIRDYGIDANTIKEWKKVQSRSSFIEYCRVNGISFPITYPEH